MSGFGPEPVADLDTQAYWDGVAAQRLLVQRCTCGTWVWQPRPICPVCSTPDPQWTQVRGDGHLVSWTVVYPPTLPAWRRDVPFAVLLVELDEGVRMVGRLVGADPDDLTIGDRVALRWRRDGVTLLPAWTPT